MRILLTGASGFVGKAVLPLLAGHEIFTLGRAAPDQPVAGHVSCDLSDGKDIADLSRAGRLPERIDAVVHLAVSRLHRTFPATAMDMFHVNVAAAAYLFDYAVSAGAQHIVLGSTGSVYDGLTETPLSETARLAPKRYFPASKAAAEWLAAEYGSLFPVAIVRFFSPYGPGQTDRLIPGLIDRVQRGVPVTLPLEGDGMKLAAIFRTDAAEIIRRAVEERWSGIVNAAAPESHTMKSAAETIARLAGKTALFERTAAAPAYALIPDLANLQSRMPGYAFTSFESGMRACLAPEAAVSA